MALKIIGTHDENTIEQARRVEASGADRVVLCADGHLGYGHPIGGVAAYRDHVSISGVGYDIGCGNRAIKLDVKAHEVGDQNTWRKLGRRIYFDLSFGVGRVNAVRAECSVIDEADWGADGLRGLKELAAAQFGTVGSGNHYVDVLKDEEEFVWIGVHFGSRGLGHKVTTHFLRAVGAKDGMDAPVALLPLGADITEAYLNAMVTAGAYADEARHWVCARVARMITEEAPTDAVSNHHNYAWAEIHGNVPYMVVRKGSTPAFPYQRSFIGASMTGQSVIVRGVDSPESAENLYSTVHGAGRAMSRTAAAGKFKGWGLTRVQVRPGLVDETAMRDDAARQGVHLFGAGADEAPQCYKSLPDVLKAHAGTIVIEHTLTPIVVCMAGADVADPYKD